MCKRSTMPVISCSAPIGRWTATQRSESCERIASSVRKKSARSRSSMFTTTTRARPRSAERCQTRPVPTSTPITPLTTMTTPSTTRSAAIVSPWKPASPGVSIRLILRSCQSTWQSVAASDIWRRCSSSSQSEAVVPCSTVPSRFVAPDWKSIASTSEVFPVPRWPATATLRSFPGSVIRGKPNRGLFVGRRADGRAGKPRLQAQDRLRVQLRDARLGHAEHLADLAEGELLVVVERDHELLPLGEARDRVGDRLAHLGLGERALRVGRLRVLDRVDEGDLVSAGAADRPQLVERGDRGAGDLGQA